LNKFKKNTSKWQTELKEVQTAEWNKEDNTGYEREICKRILKYKHHKSNKMTGNIT
jgi:6-phosphogluconate dehydrogenase